VQAHHRLDVASSTSRSNPPAGAGNARDPLRVVQVSGSKQRPSRVKGPEPRSASGIPVKHATRCIAIAVVSLQRGRSNARGRRRGQPCRAPRNVVAGSVPVEWSRAWWAVGRIVRALREPHRGSIGRAWYIEAKRGCLVSRRNLRHSPDGQGVHGSSGKYLFFPWSTTSSWLRRRRPAPP
jgi:hypothetical protein